MDRSLQRIHSFEERKSDLTSVLSCDTIFNMTQTINNLTEEQASQRSEILLALQESICSITFIKADGSERVMQCTLMESHLPVRDEVSVKTKRTPTPTNITVWDLEKSAWRSFNIKNLIRWKREN